MMVYFTKKTDQRVWHKCANIPREQEEQDFFVPLWVGIYNQTLYQWKGPPKAIYIGIQH